MLVCNHRYVAENMDTLSIIAKYEQKSFMYNSGIVVFRVSLESLLEIVTKGNFHQRYYMTFSDLINLPADVLIHEGLTSLLHYDNY